MKQFAHLLFLIAATATVVPEAKTLADGPTPESVFKLPVGKLAFVTSNSFGSPGRISFIGQIAEPFQGLRPELTASGDKVVYSNHEGSGSAFFIRDLSKHSLRKIKYPTRRVESPSLSPSESMLLFVAWSKDGESCHVHVSDADGSNEQPLTAGHHFNWLPRWSPDGTKILFETTRDGQRQVYVMDADGKNQTNLSNDQWLSHAPSWSPDGYHIAYMSRDDDNCASIFVMNYDGTEKKNISHGTTRDSEPVWSPDAEWIAFTRTANKPPKAETMDIWVMRRDGANQTQITRNKGGRWLFFPSWSR